MALPNFVSEIDNPYFPLNPGETYVYESLDGSTLGYFAVTDDTIKIMGVTCVVVQHTEYEDGVLVEKTKDYFAQDEAGNVWYFGEDVRNYEDGKFVDREGSWIAGTDGAMPGFIMLAPPNAVSVQYDQENSPGVAEDHAEVLSLAANPDAVPYGDFSSAWRIKETTPIEPTANESKYFVAGIGQVWGVNENDPTDQEVLVKIMIAGTNNDDTLEGRAGNDEINGLKGADSLSGDLGHDVFRFTALKDSKVGALHDTIEDFQDGADTIDVSALDAVHGQSGDQEFDFIGTADFTAAGQLRVVQQGGNTLVQGNVNNKLGADFEILVVGVGPGVFSAADFAL